jgi:hypothetical protein
VKVKDISASGAKFAKNAGSAGGSYIDGVRSPKRPWQESTLEAEGNFEDGINAAIADKRFAKGVASVSNASWADKAAKKGGRNYPAAVKEAGPDWIKGFDPYQRELSALTLTPRGPRGSPGNYDRVKQIGDALNKVRVGS